MSTIHADKLSRDLLKRHMQLHEEDRSNAKRPRLIGPYQPRESRVSEACQACATAKVRCDHDKPCMRCRQLQIRCEFSRQLQATRTATKGPTPRKRKCFREILVPYSSTNILIFHECSARTHAACSLRTRRPRTSGDFGALKSFPVTGSLSSRFK